MNTNTERTTKEITLTNAVIVLFEYITGREKRNIQSALLEQAQMKQTKGANESASFEMSGISGLVQHQIQDKAIMTVIKEIKVGETVITEKQKVLDFVLDLQEKDFDTVVEAINAITDPKAE